MTSLNVNDDIPIRIRDDVAVRISGLPHDITAEEAAKIIRVIQAMVPPPPRVPRGRKPRNAGGA